MNISVLCTNQSHPIVEHLIEWAKKFSSKGHFVSVVYDKSQLAGGDILFLVSCAQILKESARKKYKKSLVLHASDLPKRRGWSPHIWSILDGENEITVSLIEAENIVDSGNIWLKGSFFLSGHELLPEINEKLFKTQLGLMTEAVDRFFEIEPYMQTGDPGLYMTKRLPADSKLDPYKTIAEQFNLLRVVDSERFPAFFEFKENRYLIKIEKIINE